MIDLLKSDTVQCVAALLSIWFAMWIWMFV